MIDPFTEELLSLSQAAKLLPGRRQAKRPSVSCIYRWTTNGCRGVILESLQIGGTRCTSRQALARFIASLTAISGTNTPDAPKLLARDIATAERQLSRFGL